MIDRNISELRSGISMLSQYLGKYRKESVIGGVCVILSNLSQLPVPLLTGSVFEELARSSLNRNRFLCSIGLILSLALLGCLFSLIQKTVFVGISLSIGSALRERCVRSILSLPTECHGNYQPGDMISRIVHDIRALEQIICSELARFFHGVICSAVVLPILFYLNWRLAIGVTLFVPAMSLFVFYFSGRMRAGFKRTARLLSLISIVIQESIAGLRTIRAYAVEESEKENFNRHNEAYAEINIAIARLSSIYIPLMQALIGVCSLSLILYGGRLVVLNRLSFEQFVSFNFFLQLLVGPLVAMGLAMGAFQRGIISLSRVEELINGSSQTAPDIAGGDAAPVSGQVEFRDLSFRYSGSDRYTLRDISFVARPGAVTAFVGCTASGKSTLLNLVARRLITEKGRIWVGDLPINDIPRKTLSRFIAHVPQKPFIFSGTILENILLSAESNSRRELDEVIMKAGLDDDLARMPYGLDTWVGERGITLSGGQRQRVALARALACHPYILILDDALSAVDCMTERKILANLKNTMDGGAILISSSRIESVECADVIYLLSGGRITEYGTHEHLMYLDGEYADIYRRQFDKM